MSRDILSRATFDASLGNFSLATLQLPWEQGIFSEIFNDASTRVVPLAERPCEAQQVMQEAADLPSGEEASRSSFASPPSSCKDQVFLKHAVPVLAKKIKLNDDEIFELHVQRFELVLAHSYSASVLGRGFQGDDLEQRLLKVRLALGGKAPRTLQKRFGQAAKLVSWADSQSIKAFPIDRQIAEEYLRSLLDSGCKHSALTGATECFSFLHHVLGVDMHPDACRTPIVQGILRKTRFERPEKHQARPLLVSEVLALEAALANQGIPSVDRYCIGAFLFALYGRARLGDLKVLDCFITDLLEDTEGGCGYLEALSLSHKCRGASNSKGLRMHLVVPAKGIGPRSWGKDFLAVARECGRDLEQLKSGEPLLFLPDVHGGLSNTPADTDRFAGWARDLLCNLPGYSGDRITGHSAKATALSWMGKSGTDYDTQTILGHHVLVGRKSTLTYARDTQAAPVRKFESLLGDIRRGVFLPDSTRSGRFALAGGVGAVDADFGAGLREEPSGGVNPFTASAENSDAVDSFSFPPSPPRVLSLNNEEEPLPMPEGSEAPPCQEEEDALWHEEKQWYSCLESNAEAASEGQVVEAPAAPSEDESSSSSETSSSSSADEKVQASGERAGELGHQIFNDCLLYRHRTTRTVHLLPAGSSTSKFVCGRDFNDSVFKPVCGSVHIASFECKQCYKGRPIRDIGALNHALELASKRLRVGS